MDWNRIEGNWKEAKGKIKQKWGQLTDDDLATKPQIRPMSTRINRITTMRPKPPPP